MTKSSRAGGAKRVAEMWVGTPAGNMPVKLTAPLIVRKTLFGWKLEAGK